FVSPDREQVATYRLEWGGAVLGQINGGRSATSPHFQAAFKDRAIIVEDADVDQRFAHRQFLVAVLATSLDERGDVLLSKHLAKFLDSVSGPLVAGVAHDFSGARPLLGAPRCLDGAVGIEMPASQRAGPRVHDLDGVLCVDFVAADRPEKCL